MMTKRPYYDDMIMHYTNAFEQLEGYGLKRMPTLPRCHTLKRRHGVH